MIDGGQAMGGSEAMGGEEVLGGGDERRQWLARMLCTEVMGNGGITSHVTVGEDGTVGDQRWGKSCPCSFLLFLFSFF